MRVYHLNCGTACPLGGALVDGRSRGMFARLVCHCLLIETNAGLVLVDTGLGLRDVKRPHPRLSRIATTLANLQFHESETAIRQVEKLGFGASDVRHIIVTHLDFDHAGGLQDFPNATVHLMSDELEAAMRQRHGFIAKQRYRPMQLSGITPWCDYQVQGEAWFGFEAVRQLDGLPPEILMVPLRGHTWGHAGVAVETGEGWLLHAGDAYFYRGEIGVPERTCPPGLRLFQNVVEVSREMRLKNQERLRALSIERAGEVRIFCAHDATEYLQLRTAAMSLARQAAIPPSEAA